MKITGYTEWLFFHLWKRNSETNSTCPGILIIDTIIYRWSKPQFWYFTNKDGEIVRKTKERIFNDAIDKIFIDNDSKKHGIIAKYLSTELYSAIPIPL